MPLFFLSPRQIYGVRRLFLVDFPCFLFQIRALEDCSSSVPFGRELLEMTAQLMAFLLWSNSRLSVPSLIDFKGRKVASLEAKLNPTDALLPSACVPPRRLFSPLLPDPLKKKEWSACIISSHGLKSPGSSRLTRQVDVILV